MVTTTSRWWALGALVLSALVIGLDATVLNVALPTLAVELHATTGDLQWIVDAYLIPFAALMLPAGALGDRFGRKRVLLAGLVVFGIASVIATLADDTGRLIAARALMGAGGAAIVPLSMSVLPSLFGAEERGRAIAVWSAAMSLGLPLGPIVGGYLLDHYWWGSIFLINIPITVAALAGGALLLPESRDPSAARLDLPGALLSVTGLAALVYGVIQIPIDGWGHPRVPAGLGAGAVLLTAFVILQRGRRRPLMDLALFRDRVFVWGAIGATLVSLDLMGLLFVLPQHLQAVLGHDALGTGLRMLPVVAGIIAGGLTGERLTPHLGLRTMTASGLVVLALGFGAGAATSTGPSVTSEYGFLAAWLFVLGLGVGLVLVPAMDGVLATLPAERTGSGSATLQTLRQVGGTLGVAVLGSLLSAAYVAGLPRGVPEPVKDSIMAAASAHDGPLLRAAQDAFVTGMDLVLLICGATALPAAALMAIFLPGRTAKPGGTAESGHEQFTGAH